MNFSACDYGILLVILKVSQQVLYSNEWHFRFLRDLACFLEKIGWPGNYVSIVDVIQIHHTVSYHSSLCQLELDESGL